LVHAQVGHRCIEWHEPFNISKRLLEMTILRRDSKDDLNLRPEKLSSADEFER
jgi:hypothetical protein